MDTQNHLGHVHHTIIPLHTEYQQKTYNFLGGCLTEDGKIWLKYLEYGVGGMRMVEKVIEKCF